MSANKPKSRRELALDEAVKAAFEAKAAEPAPDHLIELVEELDAPPLATKAG